MKDKKIITITIIIMFFTLSLNSTFSACQDIYERVDIQENKNLSKLTSSTRYLLGENDEGLHQNNVVNIQEWWYYNIYFNDEESELNDWWFVISFLVVPKICSLKLELYDTENNSYGGINVKQRSFFKYNDPVLNVSIDNNSYVIGRYPNWQIHAEYTKPNETKIFVNLTFEANSLPMWMIKNTGKNRSNSIFGYYCVMDCSAYGNISIDGKTYNVSGIGYHDHTWNPLGVKTPEFSNIKNENIIKKKTGLNIYSSWEWLCVHFDNGWDMFIGKIFLDKQNIFGRLIPGSLCFTDSGEKLYDSLFFLLEYKVTKNSTVPGLEVPIKIHIKALILNTLGSKEFKGPILLDFYYEVKNLQEKVRGDPPNWVFWQSHGTTYGVAKTLGNTIQLDGVAITEITKNF